MHWLWHTEAAALPSDTFRQMLGFVPLTVYTERSAWPVEVEISAP